MNAISLQLLSLAGVVGLMLGALPVSAHAQGSWTMKAPIPLARNERRRPPWGEKST